jgi:hypothetical protein
VVDIEGLVHLLDRFRLLAGFGVFCSSVLD